MKRTRKPGNPGRPYALGRPPNLVSFSIKNFPAKIQREIRVAALKRNQTVADFLVMIFNKHLETERE